MLEAKDTVMSDEQCRTLVGYEPISVYDIKKLASAQAELTYRMIKDGSVELIKEIILREMLVYWLPSTDEDTYERLKQDMSNLADKIITEWQAFLKEKEL